MRRSNSIVGGILFCTIFIFVLYAPPVGASGVININTASQAELATLKGIGSVKAKAIIDYRETHPFASIEDIKQVKGIGDATFAAIKDFITVTDSTTPPAAPAPVAPKKSVPAQSAAPKTPPAAAASYDSAAVASAPLQPDAAQNTFWIYLLGLGALIVIAVAGALYVRSFQTLPRETTLSAAEFDITTE